MHLLKRHPFATNDVFALLLFMAINIFNFQYDNGGVETALIISSPIWGVVYWALQELLFGINGGKSFPGHSIISFVSGMMVCLLADFVLIKKEGYQCKTRLIQFRLTRPSSIASKLAGPRCPRPLTAGVRIFRCSK